MVTLGFNSEQTFAVGQSSVRKHSDQIYHQLNVSQFGNETRFGTSEFQKANEQVQAYAVEFSKESMQKYNAEVKEFGQNMVSLLDPINTTFSQKMSGA